MEKTSLQLFFFPLVYSNVCQYNEALPASDLTQTCKEKVRVQCGSAVELHQSHWTSSQKGLFFFLFKGSFLQQLSFQMSILESCRLTFKVWWQAKQRNNVQYKRKGGKITHNYNFRGRIEERKIWENKWWATSCLLKGGVTLPAFLIGPPFVAEGNGFDKRIEGNLAVCATPRNKPFVNEATASQQRATVALQSYSEWKWQGEER